MTIALIMRERARAIVIATDTHTYTHSQKDTHRKTHTGSHTNRHIKTDAYRQTEITIRVKDPRWEKRERATDR